MRLNALELKSKSLNFSDDKILNMLDYDIESDTVIIIAKETDKNIYEKYDNCYVYENSRSEFAVDKNIIIICDVSSFKKESDEKCNY